VRGGKLIPRLVLGFILLSPLPMAGLAWLYIQAFEGSLNETLLANLSSIADKKTDQIDAYLNERLANNRVLAKSPVAHAALLTLSPLLAQGADSPRYRAAEKRFREYFRTTLENAGYYDLLLTDADGNVVFSILHEADFGSNLNSGPYRDSTLASAHREALALLSTQTTAVQPYAPSANQPAIFMVTPILKEGKAIGSVALQLDLENLTTVTSDTTGLGLSGETVLAQQDGEQALYVGPLRHIPNANFRHRVAVAGGKLAQPMFKALHGGHDQGLTRDYVGNEVIAAWRYLPALRWGMVVKIDAAEAFAPAQRLRTYTFWALALLLLLATVAALLFGRTLVQPIRRLTDATRRIAAGDLANRTTPEGCDEFRQLALSFNAMADQLAEERALLELRVTERTFELAHSREQYVELTARIPIGVYTFRIKADGSMNFDYVSPRFCQMLELPTEQVLADVSVAFAQIHPDDHDGFMRMNREVAKTLQPFLWEGRFVIHGEIRWFHIESTPTPQDNGDSLWNGVINEISQRKILEQTLQENATRFRSIFERANTGIAFADATGNLLQFNDSFARLVEYPAEELWGMNFARFTHPEDIAAELAYYREIMTGQRDEYRLEKRYLTKTGTPVWVDLAVSVIRDEQGQALNFVGLAVDISERKLAEEALQAAKQAAETANRAKSEFLANMSHEIRTPMNAILGLTQLVLESQLTPQQRDFLGKVQTSSRSLLGVLNDILDYSKIEAGRMALDATPFRLEESLEKAADLFAARIAEKGLELFIEIAPSTPTEIVGDPLRLSQVLNNLFGNAVKFTERGEIHLKVDVASHPGDVAMLRFTVRDTGIGVAREQAEHLFQPFTQADGSITRHYGGTGLGLAICKRLVDLMGGEIALSSAPGQGTSVSFTMRVGLAQPSRQATDLQQLRGLRALVVDDQATSRLILQNLLQAWEIGVESAASGTEALARIKAAPHPFDILLLDWRMPEMDGLEVARQVEQHLARSRLAHPLLMLMVAAHDKEQLLSHAGPLHLDGVLTKPVIPSRLLAPLVNWRRQQPQPIEEPTGDSDPRWMKGARLLLVEDNPLNQQVAFEFLKRRGAVVTLAGHGGEAVERAAGGAFDAVLMDIHMPVMDGFEATRRIHALPGYGELPIIAMTAAVLQADREQCRAAGMVDFVAKPIDPDELNRVLEKWLRPAQTAIPAAATEVSPIAECPLPALPGFDLEQALRRLDGNIPLLTRLLRSLADEQAHAGTRLDALLQAGDRKQAALLLHSIKGCAANLGATALAGAAARLEQEVKEDAAPVSQATFDAALNDTLRLIAQHFAAPAQAPQAKGDERAGLLHLVTGLLPYLREQELLPDQLLGELHQLAAALPSNALLTSLVRQIDHFDHGGAVATLTRIIAAHGLEIPQ